MKRERFDSMILDGHEGLAFEIPFGPGQRWRTTAVRLRRGRLGHRVRGTVNKVLQSPDRERVKYWNAYLVRPVAAEIFL